MLQGYNILYLRSNFSHSDTLLAIFVMSQKNKY